MYILHDDLEQSLPIPHGRYDVPLIIKDALFEQSGALIFDDHGESGLFGGVILVNGKPWPFMDVERRKYRFRMLNASISRSYDIALDTGGPMTVIASEGGLYPEPQTVTSSGFTDVVANPRQNGVEIWELRNKSGGWFHPVHIHLVDFKILDRNGQPPHAYELGGKDTVYVGEGESVRVIARFGPHAGRYMIHCHNLVHEDHDMMVQYEVGAGGPDPITADPAVPDPTA